MVASGEGDHWQIFKQLAVKIVGNGLKPFPTIENLKRTIMKIGNTNIENGIFLAPMEDVSDYPFRMICKKFGADVVYSEFISSEALIRDAAKAFKKMTIHPEEHPIGIQIYGNRVDSMVRAAQIAEEKGPDFIDINFGCPVKKVRAPGCFSIYH